MKDIILTREQADRVRGISTPGAELDPIERIDGTFALPASVLADPAHARHWEALRLLPQDDSTPDRFKWFADAESLAPPAVAQLTKR